MGMCKNVSDYSFQFHFIFRDKKLIDFSIELPSEPLVFGANFIDHPTLVKATWYMSKFSCLFFGHPTNKTVSGTAHMWELLIPNHLDQSL
jgi:hypothetical protein